MPSFTFSSSMAPCRISCGHRATSPHIITMKRALVWGDHPQESSDHWQCGSSEHPTASLACFLAQSSPHPLLDSSSLNRSAILFVLCLSIFFFTFLPSGHYPTMNVDDDRHVAYRLFGKTVYQFHRIHQYPGPAEQTAPRAIRTGNMKVECSSGISGTDRANTNGAVPSMTSKVHRGPNFWSSPPRNRSVNSN